jgi:glucokinase
MNRTNGTRLLAFDIGGTRLKAGLAGDTGVDGSIIEDIAGRDAAHVLAEVRRIGGDLTSHAQFRGVGLCAPGLISAQGTVISLPGKLAGLEGHDLAGMLTEEFGVPAVVVNDAIAHGVGEACSGAGRGRARVVVMTIGTGVGVSVVHDGAPITAGPIGGGIMGGHIPISDRTAGVVDSNGRPDTIEAHCCAQRIVDYANDAGEDARSVAEVFAAYSRGSMGARRGIDVYRTHMARAVVALAHAHAPDVIVLGGGAMTRGNPVIDGLSEMVNDRLFGSYSVEVAVARLGEQAALLGLAHIHRRRHGIE